MPALLTRRKVLVNTRMPSVTAVPSTVGADGLCAPSARLAADVRAVFDSLADGTLVPDEDADIIQLACDHVHDETLKRSKSEGEACRASDDLNATTSRWRRVVREDGLCRAPLAGDEKALDSTGLYLLTAVAKVGAPFVRHAMLGLRQMKGRDDTDVQKLTRAHVTVKTLLETRGEQPLPPLKFLAQYDHLQMPLLWETATVPHDHPLPHGTFAIPTDMHPSTTNYDELSAMYNAQWMAKGACTDGGSSALVAPAEEEQPILDGHAQVDASPAMATVGQLWDEYNRLFKKNQGAEEDKAGWATAVIYRICSNQELTHARSSLALPIDRQVRLHVLVRKAFEWTYQKARDGATAQATNAAEAQALFLLGYADRHFALCSKWLQRDGPRAEDALKRACKFNHPAAHYYFGRHLEKRRFGDLALVKFQDGDELGSALCTMRLAQARFYGDLGLEVNRPRALATMQRLAASPTLATSDIPVVCAQLLQEAEALGDNVYSLVPAGNDLSTECHRLLRVGARLGNADAALALASLGREDDLKLMRGWFGHDDGVYEEDAMDVDP